MLLFLSLSFFPVIIYFNMLGSDMLNWAMCYVNSGPVVTVELHRPLSWNSQVFKQLFRSKKFTDSMSSCSKLSFCITSSSNRLLFIPPGIKVAYNKRKITLGKSPVYYTSSPISITVGFNLNTIVFSEPQAFSWTPFQVTENPINRLKVFFFWRLHELIYNITE